MVNVKHKKICIVVSSLGIGGVERSMATLSKILSDLGYDVHLVTVLNQIEYDFAGTLFNLGELKDKKDSFVGKFQRFLSFQAFLKAKKFDLIIDSRPKTNTFKELLIYRLLYNNQNLVRVVHSSKLDTYLYKNKWIFNRIFKPVKAFVCVSNEIREQVQKIYDINNVKTIYNAIDIANKVFNANDIKAFEFEYILYYGRLDDRVKNISLLIDSYSASKLKSLGVKLFIMGDGNDKSKLMDKVKILGLEDLVAFIPFTKNPFPYIVGSKFTVLTSRYEGFPMVIIESLSAGIPVVSVDCSGPTEVIITGYNGLLVENFNKNALAEAMNNFIFDESLYRICKNNSKKSVEKFSMQKISEDWERLIQEIA